jgi:hypothetical protein
VTTPNVKIGVTTPNVKNRTFRFVAETYRQPKAKCNTFLQRKLLGFSLRFLVVRKRSMPLKKAHAVAVANSAKRQNALGATSRKQLTLKHLPILVLNGSVESFSTPSFVSATQPQESFAECFGDYSSGNKLNP